MGPAGLPRWHCCLPLALAAGLLFAAPAAEAARKPVAPPLPPLELSPAAPLIDIEFYGQRLRLTVDFGGDDVVQINPGAAVRALLAADVRPDGSSAQRGQYRVAVGQSTLAIPFTRETLDIADRPVQARVLLPLVAPPGQPTGSDGSIGLPLLPHDAVRWRWRASNPRDQRLTVPARIGRSDAWGFDWPLAGGERLDVELHPLRPMTVASAAAASALAKAGDGRLIGPVVRVPISFGAVRPVRQLQLARPVNLAGVPVSSVMVRLFDWAGRSQLPPDADADSALTVTSSRGRQDRWTNVKLGADLLAGCASISWHRRPAELVLECPATP